jgi:hypothetical protein
VILTRKHRSIREKTGKMPLQPTAFLTWTAPGSNLTPRADTPEVQKYNMMHMKIHFLSAAKLIIDSVTA